MRVLKTYYFIILTVLFLFINSCTEEIDFKTESFESALVIEATITNEMKFQEIILSRTFAFEEDGPNPETSAEVSIESDNGEIVFQEIEDGKYVSVNEFKAQPTINYTLKITTSNGRKYSSTQTQLTQSTQIDQLYAVRETNNDGVNGMAIYVDSFDPTGNSNFYRYEYEETYKIIAPQWAQEDIVVLNEFYPCTVDLIEREQEEQICYNTVNSININQKNTSALNEDRITRHLIHFIKSDNYILSHRYSILTRQYVQSQQAFSYYETLKIFSEESSIFSQIQPGFINGNVFSENNPLEKVAGFFDVSTISIERIFFNYSDFYPNENMPSFPYVCEPTLHELIIFSPNTLPRCGPLVTELLADRVAYHHGASKILDTITNDYITIGPFFMVLKECGDCTSLGSNIVPEFWEE